MNGSVSGGIVSADGEVLARGVGAVGNDSNDCMRYDEGMDISVAQGLATVFGPL